MIKVECNSGYQIKERPVAFQFCNRRYKVKEVVDRWYGDGEVFFNVEADDNNICLLIYEEGQGGPMDLVRAYFWYSVAAASGHMTGENNRYRLAPELTVEQLNSASRSLKEWRDGGL